MTEPLIFTKLGNVPVADLKHEVEWRISPEQIIFIERYRFGEDVVKESTHVKLLIGASAVGEAET